MPFTFVVQEGGQGATVVLTVSNLPTFPFLTCSCRALFKFDPKTCSEEPTEAHTGSEPFHFGKRPHADEADHETLPFSSCRNRKSRCLTSEALFKQKCNPNHNQDGRPQHCLAHVPHSIRL